MTEQADTPDDADRGDVEPAAFRASDAEREAIVARLNVASGEGRLTLDEYSQRLERVYQAQVRGELDALVADLPQESAEAGTARYPSGTAPVKSPGGTAERTHWHVTPIGGMSRRGRWRVARRTVLITLIGGMSLDLSEAELSAEEVTLTKWSLVGGVDIKVPPGIRVEASGFTLLGGTHIASDGPTSPGAPTVRIRCFGILGGLSVTNSRPPDGLRRARRGELRRDLRDEIRQSRRDRRF